MGWQKLGGTKDVGRCRAQAKPPWPFMYEHIVFEQRSPPQAIHYHLQFALVALSLAVCSFAIPHHPYVSF